MDSTKPKYEAVSGFEDAEAFEGSINALAKQGYGVAHLQISEGKLSAVLKLKDGPAVSFQGCEELINVDITRDSSEMRKLLAKGYEVVANYPKQATLIKRRASEKPQPKTG